MRQRKAKDLDKRLRECSDYIVPLPEDGGRSYGEIGSKDPNFQSPEHEAALRQLWEACFPRQRDLYLEIGCGKGDFITRKAAKDPASDFLAIEGQETVILRALEKAKGLTSEELPDEARREPLQNLKFMLTFVDHMSDYFLENQLSGVYLNFSDPWPKARHAKRRLTYHKRLQNYKQVLQTGGFIEFKTDNEALFEFTLEEIKQCGYPIVEMTRDLHRSAAAEPRHLLTETGGFGCTHPARHAEVGSYAEKSRTFLTEYEAKFSAQGKNINFVRI